MSKTLASWLSTAGISRTNAEKVVKKPQKIAVIENFGAALNFCVSRVEATKPASTILVAAQQLANGTIDMNLVIRVFDDFDPELAALDPVELLRRFCDRFGTTVSVGLPSDPLAVRKKLFLDEVVPLSVPTPNGMVPLGFDVSPNAIGSALAMVRADPLRVQCLLVCQLDVAAYQSYMSAH